MGSGKYIKRAIAKYGIENFQKEILFILNSEEEMNNKESELVTEEFCLRNDTYNICVGGKGGWSYINNTYWDDDKRQKHNDRVSGFKNLDRTLYDYKTFSKTANEQKKKLISEDKLVSKPFLNKSHTDETKKRMSDAKKGLGIGPTNSQYGTIWITNGIENRKIKKEIGTIPEEWYKGRTVKKL